MSLLGLMCRRIATNNYRHVSRRNMCELLRPAAPYMMLPPDFPGGGKMVYNFYSPTEDKLVSFSNRGGREEADLMEESEVVGSSRGWLSLFNHRTPHMSLCNPLSGRRVGLPPLAGEPDMLPPKVIISSSSPGEKDCLALIFFCKGKPAVCSPGRSKAWVPLGEWSPPVIGRFRSYTDFIYSAARKRFFGLATSFSIHVPDKVEELVYDKVEELEGWEIDASSGSLSSSMERLNRFRSSSVESHRTPNILTMSHSAEYLVYEEESDQLFMVRRYQVPDPDRPKIYGVLPSMDREKVDFDVYRVDLDDGRMELCSSLDDLVIFVGINESFAVRASRFPLLKPNTIYFSDARVKYADELDCQTMEAFDYQDKTCSPVYYPSRNLKSFFGAFALVLSKFARLVCLFYQLIY